jgi:formate dehydrogenase major subunit
MTSQKSYWSDKSMPKLTIDNKEFEVPAGTTVLRAADQAGIPIPRLCDHPQLIPYGGCRLCVVEVEGARVLQPSCTLPVSEGMVVRTDTPQVQEAREFVLSMLFSERNHFCMYCQVSNGDCELQNAALGQGMTHWPLQPTWNAYPVDASHPYFIFDHNRCILCRRCVRACGSLVGSFTLGAEERGAKTMIVADYNVPMGESTCLRCGTCVQVCPTGSLIDRQSAYLGRAVDADLIQSICVGCAVGCGVTLLVRDNNLMRIDSNWEAPVNNGVLCEEGRYKPRYDERQRITVPLVRKDGSLKAATWAEAIALIAEKLRPLRGKHSGGIAAAASTRLPAEALAAFKALFSGLDSQVVTSLEEGAATARIGYPEAVPAGLRGSLQDLKEADLILAIGVDLYSSHQVAGFFVRRNLPLGASLIVIDPGENAMHAQAHVSLRPAKGADALVLRGLATQTLQQASHKDLQPLHFDVHQYAPEHISKEANVAAEDLRSAAVLLAQAKKPVFVFGKGLAWDGAGLPTPTQALFKLAGLIQARLLSPGGRANALAAHAYGLDQAFEPDGAQAAYIALGDDEVSQRLLKRLDKVPFLAVQASYATQLSARADVVLPVEMWAEQEGHFLNLEGRLQAAARAVDPAEGVESNRKALQSLALALGIPLTGDWQAPLSQFQILSVVPT